MPNILCRIFKTKRRAEREKFDFTDVSNKKKRTVISKKKLTMKKEKNTTPTKALPSGIVCPEILGC